MDSSFFGEDGVEDLFNDRIHQDNELPDDENVKADAETKVVEPKKRIHRTRQRLTLDTLTGSRGVHTIEQYFTDIKYKGRGYEKQDLCEMLKRLRHWGHRMYPSYKFEDVLTNIERLGKKKSLQVHMSRYRLGLLENVQMNLDTAERDDIITTPQEDEPFDEFDALINKQIAISKLIPKTPVLSSVTMFDRGNIVMSTPMTTPNFDKSDLAQPLSPSQPSTPEETTKQNKLSSEQLALIAENRKKAQEILFAKKLQQQGLQRKSDET